MKLLDVVALTRDLPSTTLRKGQVGTLVEQLGADVFEVEFANLKGETYASLAISANDLMVLHHAPVGSAA